MRGSEANLQPAGGFHFRWQRDRCNIVKKEKLVPSKQEVPLLKDGEYVGDGTTSYHKANCLFYKEILKNIFEKLTCLSTKNLKNFFHKKKKIDFDTN